MTTYEADLEQTTALALEEKSKLDQVAAALRHGLLHGLRVRRPRHARNGRLERAAGLRLARRRSPLVFVLPVRAADGRGRVDVHRGGRALRVDEARLGPLRRRHRRDPLLGHEPALGRRLARLHRGRRLGRERVRDRAAGRGATTSSSCSSSGSRSASRSRRCATASGSRTSARSCASARSASSRSRVVVYGAEHGFHGFSAHDASPTTAVFIGLVPVLLFNYVGFELQNGAAEEMENPSRDVPISVFQAARARRAQLRDPDPRHPARAAARQGDRDRRLHRRGHRGVLASTAARRTRC